MKILEPYEISDATKGNAVTESELQNEVQALADAMAAKAIERGESMALPIGIMLGAIWELAQREFPGDLVGAKNWHRKILKGNVESVAALRR